MINVIAEMGRVTNTKKDPPEMIRDLLKFCSRRGPKTKAITKGAPSYLNFLMR